MGLRSSTALRLIASIAVALVTATLIPSASYAFRGIDYWQVDRNDDEAAAMAVYEPYDYHETRYIWNLSFPCVGSGTPSQQSNGTFNTLCWFCCNNGSLVRYIAFALDSVPDPMPEKEEWALWCITS